MGKDRKSEKPIVVGVVGDSASGKTTLVSGIAQILGPDKVTLLCTDDYHKYDRENRRRNGLSALDPESNYLDVVGRDLHTLRSGKAILKPVYNHESGTLERPIYMEPRAYIIVDGLLGFFSRALRASFDVKVFMEPTEDLRVQWKIRRDTQERGYTKAQVRASLAKRQKDSESFVQPQRAHADIVIQFYPPSTDAGETGAHLNVRHILRPTLPHPDLSPLLDAGARNKIRLDLKRDRDGKPVDILEIPGDLDDKRAGAMTDLLWNLIPEARHLRDNVGQFTDESNQQVMSHPLALSQLFVTYHSVKAALGHLVN